MQWDREGDKIFTGFSTGKTALTPRITIIP